VASGLNLERLFVTAIAVGVKIMSELKTIALNQAKAIDAKQHGYQPYFGLPELGDGDRARILERNCDLVVKHFERVARKQQVRIYDVGCNAGFVTMTLAKTFPTIVGLEISPEHLELCRTLAKLTGSPAQFRDTNLIDQMIDGKDDLVGIDCLLLFNIVHQFVFLHGIPATQALLARAAKGVDVIFVELALRSQYKSHGKDHMLPHDPLELLAACDDADITQIAESPRPLYRIERRTAYFGPISVKPDSIVFSDNAQPWVSRKYYLDRESFVKVYRFNERHGPSACRAEIRSLLRMQGTGIAPVVKEWTISPTYGAVKMQRLWGKNLSSLLSDFSSADQRTKIAKDFISVCRVVSDKVGFHNDLSLHNIIYERGRLMVVDYEQSSDKPYLDQFAMIMWGLHDIIVGSTVSYEKRIYAQLKPTNGQRAAEGLYPPPLDNDFYSKALAKALSAESFHQFLAEIAP
jgi:tRNA A-37 threonylcarbamoyl transferase component Bud32